MGESPTTITMNGTTSQSVLYFGCPSSIFFLKWKTMKWAGLSPRASFDNYAVRLHLDSMGRVVRIERGIEIEE